MHRIVAAAVAVLHWGPRPGPAAAEPALPPVPPAPPAPPAPTDVLAVAPELLLGPVDQLAPVALLAPETYRMPNGEQPSPYVLTQGAPPGLFPLIDGWKGVHALVHGALGRMPGAELGGALPGTAPPAGDSTSARLGGIPARGHTGPRRRTRARLSLLCPPADPVRLRASDRGC